MLTLSILAPLEKTMPLKITQLFFQVILINLLLMPFSVSATVFNPLEDVNLNLTGNTTFNYDTFTLNEGVTLNYFAAENSLIEIISEGDIFIGGEISTLLDNNTTLSFTSISGSFTVAGKISANHLSLVANTIVVSDGAMLSATGDTKLSTTGTSGSMLSITGSRSAILSRSGMLSTTGVAGSILVSGTGENIILNTGSLVINPGTIFLQPINLTTIKLPTIVPLPAPLWLFVTALLSLFTLRNTKT